MHAYWNWFIFYCMLGIEKELLNLSMVSEYIKSFRSILDAANNTLVNVYVDLVVFTRIAGTS